MAGPCVLNDTSDLEELSKQQGLFLKPIARLNISVQLPHLTEPGKAISNWEVMEKMKGMAKPDVFTMIKVAKSTMDFVRFEAEVESKSILKSVLTRVDGGTIKLSGFTEILKVKAAEAKLPFPVRHDWDSFFRDSKDMNEMAPGERPDTIHLELLPCKWFFDQRFQSSNKPSPHVLQRVFESFGEIRCVDIPVLDPYRRNNMKEAKTFSTFDAHLTFEAYIQYVEYISFVKAMDALRGMKLVFREKPHLVIPKKSKEGEEGGGGGKEADEKREEKEEADDDGDNEEGKAKGGTEKEAKEAEGGEDWKAMLGLSDDEAKRKEREEKAKSEEPKDEKKEEVIRTSEPRVWMADIKVDFDKTKHLTDEKIQKRKGKMEKYIRDEQEKAAKEQRRREDEARRREEEVLSKEQAHLREIKEKEAKRLEREEKRRKKRHEQKIAIKIATEERKILIASRKLETIRLLEELFNRIRLVKHQEQVEQRMLKLEEMKKKELENAAEQQLKEEARKLRREEKRRQKLLQMEEVFKKRLVLKMRAQQEKQKEINREKARLEIQVKGSKLSSAASVAVIPAVVHPAEKAPKKPRRGSSHGVMARETFNEEKQQQQQQQQQQLHHHYQQQHRVAADKERVRREAADHRAKKEERRRKRKAEEEEEEEGSSKRKDRHRRQGENDDDEDEDEEEERRSKSRGSRSKSRSKSRGKSQRRRSSSRSDREGDSEVSKKSDKDAEEADRELINKITNEVGDETSTLLYGKSVTEPKASTSNQTNPASRGRANFMAFHQNRGRGRNVFPKFDPSHPPNFRGRGRGFFRGRGRPFIRGGFFMKKDAGFRDDAFMRKYYRMPADEDHEDRSTSDEDDSDDDDDDDDDDKTDDEGRKSRRRHKKKHRDDNEEDDDDDGDDESDERAERRRRRPPKKLPIVPLDRPMPGPFPVPFPGRPRGRGFYQFPPPDHRRPHFFHRGYQHGGDFDGGRPKPLYRRRDEHDEDGGDDDDDDEEERERERAEPRRRVERERSSSSKPKKHKKHKKRKKKGSSDDDDDDRDEIRDGGDD